MFASLFVNQISSVQSLSHVWLFVTPWTEARQASLSITNSRSLLKLMSIESVIPSNPLATWCKELTHLKRPWCWKRLKAGGEGDDRGWDGWMASLTRWTWVWVSSWSWWWTGKPGVLQSMGSQRIRHDWVTELNWCISICRCLSLTTLEAKWSCQMLCVCVYVFSLVWLFVIPWTAACQAPLSKGFSRQEYWSGLLFPPPGIFPPRNWTWEPESLVSPALAGGFFTLSHLITFLKWIHLDVFIQM